MRRRGRRDGGEGEPVPGAVDGASGRRGRLAVPGRRGAAGGVKGLCRPGRRCGEFARETAMVVRAGNDGVQRRAGLRFGWEPARSKRVGLRWLFFDGLPFWPRWACYGRAT